jgi:hypothetical protein
MIPKNQKFGNMIPVYPQGSKMFINTKLSKIIYFDQEKHEEFFNAIGDIAHDVFCEEYEKSVRSKYLLDPPGFKLGLSKKSLEELTRYPMVTVVVDLKVSFDAFENTNDGSLTDISNLVIHSVTHYKKIYHKGKIYSTDQHDFGYIHADNSKFGGIQQKTVEQLELQTRAIPVRKKQLDENLATNSIISDLSSSDNYEDIS